MSNAIDTQADVFVNEYASKISPVTAYIGGTYGTQNIWITTTAAVVKTITHAVEYCTFESLFERKRAALAALSLAEKFIKDTSRLQDILADSENVLTLEDVDYALTVIASCVGKLAVEIADMTIQELAE